MAALPRYRLPFGSGLSAYGLEPLTLLFHIPGSPGRFNEGPQLAGNFYEHYLSLVHECAHWLQFHGTTFGALTQLVAGSQAQNALGRLEAMSRSKRNRLLEQRIRQKKPPVVGELADKTGDAEIDDLRENWLEHEYAYKLLLDGLDASFKIDRDVLLKFILGVCCIGVAAQTGAQHYYGDAWARDVFRPGERGVFELATADGRLSVRTLMEGAATAQEYLAAGNLADLDRFDRRQQAVTLAYLRGTLTRRKSAYAVAFRYFTQVLRLRISEAFCDDVLQLFSLLVDLAMNPTVPPVVIGQEYRSEWNEIYPPVRFYRLLHALNSCSSEVRKALSISADGGLMSDLVSKAGLPPIPAAIGPDWGSMTYQEFRTGKERNTVMMEHQRYRHWVQAKMWALRRKYWRLFTTVDDAILGGTAEQKWRYLGDEDSKGWFLPPFRWAYKGEGEETLGFQNIDEDHGSDIVVSAAVQTAHFNLVRRCRPLELSQYPRGYRPYLRRCIRASYDQRFGCAVLQEW